MVVRFTRTPKNTGRYLEYLLRDAMQADRGFQMRAYGQGARALGLEGRAFTVEQLNRLSNGLTPDGATRLLRKHRYRRGTFEIGMHFPATVSKAGEVIDEARFRELVKAAEKAAHDVMRKLEKAASFTRVTEGGKVRREPVGLVYIPFVHVRNRNDEVSFHVHIVVVNLGVRKNGLCRTLENKRFLDAQRPAHRIFDQAVSYHVRAGTGLRVVPAGDSIRVQGVDNEWAKTTRREEIVKALQGAGLAGPVAALHEALKTRRPKTDATLGELRKRWRERAHTLGRYAADLVVRPLRGMSDRWQSHKADVCYKKAARALRKTTTHFSALQVDAFAAMLARGREVHPDKLFAAGERFRARPERYGLDAVSGEREERLYTSARRRSVEEKMFSTLARMERQNRCKLTPRALAAAIPGGFRSEDLLTRAASFLRGSGAIAGEAMVPQDPALKLALTAYRRRGYEVLAVASDRQGASWMHRELDVRAQTARELVDSLRPVGHMRAIAKGIFFGKGGLNDRLAMAEEIRRNRPLLPRRCVVVADLKASDAAELRVILSAVRKARGKVIFAGSSSNDFARGMEAAARQREQEFHNREHQRGYTP